MSNLRFFVSRVNNNSTSLRFDIQICSFQVSSRKLLKFSLSSAESQQICLPVKLYIHDVPLSYSIHTTREDSQAFAETLKVFKLSMEVRSENFSTFQTHFL